MSTWASRGRRSPRPPVGTCPSWWPRGRRGHHRGHHHDDRPHGGDQTLRHRGHRRGPPGGGDHHGHLRRPGGAGSDRRDGGLRRGQGHPGPEAHPGIPGDQGGPCPGLPDPGAPRLLHPDLRPEGGLPGGQPRDVGQDPEDPARPGPPRGHPGDQPHPRAVLHGRRRHQRRHRPGHRRGPGEGHPRQGDHPLPPGQGQGDHRGDSLEANIQLVFNNAKLAAQTAAPTPSCKPYRSKETAKRPWWEALASHRGRCLDLELSPAGEAGRETGGRSWAG